MRNELDVRRTFWRPHDTDPEKSMAWQAVEHDEVVWSLDCEAEGALRAGASSAGAAAAGATSAGPVKVLTVCMAKPKLTEEERVFKKGKRQDNRFAPEMYAPGVSRLPDAKGKCFFIEDQDDFGLAVSLVLLLWKNLTNNHPAECFHFIQFFIYLWYLYYYYEP